MEKEGKVKKGRIRQSGSFNVLLRLDKEIEMDLKLLYAWEKREAIHGALRGSGDGKHGHTGYLSFNMWLNKVIGEYLHKKKPFLDSLKGIAERVGALSKEDLEALQSKARDDV
jgi:hypothetical protein